MCFLFSAKVTRSRSQLLRQKPSTFVSSNNLPKSQQTFSAPTIAIYPTYYNYNSPSKQICAPMPPPVNLVGIPSDNPNDKQSVPGIYVIQTQSFNHPQPAVRPPPYSTH
ncbi:hypothetical protein AB6A40_001377 [Gnathostoma spinigerum]|uniref:Uncharacterized protein n=1 Tax=Gnathostoma spinigerum TaxID=75299 RepID=A0ABD6ECW4_9BILA